MKSEPTIYLILFYISLFFGFIFIISIREQNDSGAQSQAALDASTRKWKQLPSDFRKIVWQIKKIEKDDSEDFEDEDADFDDITEFEVSPSISTTREDLQHFLLKKDPSPDQVTPKEGKKTLNLIIGDQYSGAGYISQVLNQRNDALVLFEPLGLYGQGSEKDLEMKIKTIQQFGHCAFPILSDVVRNHLKKQPVSWTGKSCLEHNMCFRHRSKILLAPPFCPVEMSTEHSKLSQVLETCGPVSLSVLMQLCKSPDYPIKAARLTRLSSLHELQHIAGDEALDVKILYVIRDPAGMNQSLIKSKKSTELEAYCYQTLSNLNYLGNKLISSWAEDRVRIVKLEDFRSNQADYINSINKFFDINEQPEVRKWFAKNLKEVKPDKYLKSGQRTACKGLLHLLEYTQ